MPIFAYVMLPEFKKWMCYIDGQKNKYSVLNECNRMLKYNIYGYKIEINKYPGNAGEIG
jgi:hypothetical protein